jgi:hypothetical protein
MVIRGPPDFNCTTSPILKLTYAPSLLGCVNATLASSGSGKYLVVRTPYVAGMRRPIPSAQGMIVKMVPVYPGHHDPSLPISEVRL